MELFAYAWGCQSVSAEYAMGSQIWMELKDLKVQAINYLHGEYRPGAPVEIIDEGSFYWIDGTHIIDKFKIRSIQETDEKVKVEMKNRVVFLEV